MLQYIHVYGLDDDFTVCLIHAENQHNVSANKTRTFGFICLFTAFEQMDVAHLSVTQKYTIIKDQSILTFYGW